MKTLYLMRHAKSDWNNNSTDLNRPLNKRGRRNALQIGEWLAQHDEKPELIVSSPAMRAEHTARLIAETVGYTQDVAICEELYYGDEQEVLEFLYGHSPRLHSIMIVGHNPVWDNLFKMFAMPDNEKFPTAATAKINFLTNVWRDISPQNASFDWFIKPRELEEQAEPEANNP